MDDVELLIDVETGPTEVLWERYSVSPSYRARNLPTLMGAEARNRSDKALWSYIRVGTPFQFASQAAGTGETHILTVKCVFLHP